MISRPECKITTGVGSDGLTITSLVLRWSERYTNELILNTVEEAVRDGVRKHLLEDPEFRAQVSEAIRVAAAAMPLDAITKAVREAIKEQSTEGNAENTENV